MRKLISATKRKFVLGGILGFAGVSLATTGFATWVVGVTRTSVKDGTNVSVHTATNNSVAFEVEFDAAVTSDNPLRDGDSIVLAEGSEVTGDEKIVKTGESGSEVAYVANPLQIRFSKFSITWGSDYTFNYTKVNFRLVKSFTKVDTKNDHGEVTGSDYEDLGVQVTTQSLSADSGVTPRSMGSGMTYIDAPNDYTLNLDSSSESGATNTEGLIYKIDENTSTHSITLDSSKDYIAFDFKWGSFFGNSSPATYYNNLYADVKSYEKLAIGAVEIQTELKTMKSYFENATDASTNPGLGGNLNLVISLSK